MLVHNKHDMIGKRQMGRVAVGLAEYINLSVSFLVGQPFQVHYFYSPSSSKPNPLLSPRHTYHCYAHHHPPTCHSSCTRSLGYCKSRYNPKVGLVHTLMAFLACGFSWMLISLPGTPGTQSQRKSQAPTQGESPVRTLYFLFLYTCLLLISTVLCSWFQFVPHSLLDPEAKNE